MDSSMLRVPRFKVPSGLDSLLEELIRTVLKAQPKNIELFIADHLSQLIILRDRAATGSSQTSPSDIVKHIVDHERSKTISESSRVPPVSQEPTSMYSSGMEDPNSEMAERGSLHCVEATAVRRLAANTGSVAILGTTAKYNENIEYRHSVHSEQAFPLETKDEAPVTEKEEHEFSEKELIREPDITTPSDVDESTDIVTTAIIEVPPDSVTNRYESPSEADIHPLPEDHLPKVIDTIVKQSAVLMNSAKDVESEPDMRESSFETNENSEVGSSSSEVISVVKQDSKEDDFVGERISSEASRPNRLSLGRYSIESEISSADDVKNESTDITSPESLRESIDESPVFSSSSKKSNVKEISNTSLNTLGDDSDEDGSELEADFGSKRGKSSVKRFDTISSNGESSYRMEEPNYASATEETESNKFAESPSGGQEMIFGSQSYLYMDDVRDIAANEVDRICQEAIDKMSDILLFEPNAEDANNESESPSVLSAVDSIIAERGSDFDSLSFLDEPSDSRSVSILGDDTKTFKSETMNKPSTGVTSPQDEVQRTLFDVETPSASMHKEATTPTRDNFETVIVAKNSSQLTSEDLPRPPDLADLPPLPENLDQYDITEEELKAVALPESAQLTELGIDAAASKIQAGVRGYLTRKQIKDLKNGKTGDNEADTFDTESLRLHAKNKRLSLDSKLIDIENIRKLPKLKATLSECAEEGEIMNPDKAATKIQTTFRNYRARKSICLGERNAIKQKIRSENTTINGSGKNERDLMDEKLVLEENEPSIIGANQSVSKADEGVNVEEEDDAIKQAAVRIQATYRGFRTRKSIQISTSAATIIQAHFRGYKVRKSIKRSSSLNDLAANSNSSSCSNISGSRHTDLEKHVTKIQAGVRGYLVRKRHSLQNSAATTIQLNYKRYKSRKMSLANTQTNKTDI